MRESRGLVVGVWVSIVAVLASAATGLAVADGRGREEVGAGQRNKGEVTLPEGPAATALAWVLEKLESAPTEHLCRAHGALQRVATHADRAPIREILAANAGRGLTFKPPPDYGGFKGGSEPGVLAGSWLFEHSDGRRFVIATQLRSPGSSIDTTALLVVPDAWRLLAAEPRH